MRLTCLRSPVVFAMIALLLSGLALLLGPSPRAWSAAQSATGHVYVLNNNLVGPNSITVFHIDINGFLHRLARAISPLSTAHPDPAQVQIDPLGQFLLVTEKATNLIDVYPINSDGSLGGLTTFSSVGATPFGMAFKPASTRDEFIVSDAAGGPNGTGAASAYSLTNGSIGLINGPVADHLKAPCWMVVTHNGLFAYTSNADSHAISGYGIQGNGTISLLNSNGVTATTPSDTFPIEEALSSASQLYVLDTRVML